ncbi:hypothetical protein P7C73_g4994, partial [Tremellales sp. Uapishka_1]
MSLPSGGSTAPAISSPLLAWPARPSPRPSPLSTPSASTFDSFAGHQSSYHTRQTSRSSGGSWTEGKGKGKATVETPSVRIVGDEDLFGDGESSTGSPRNYPPPSRPLNQQKLGRIAQSFGIVIPSHFAPTSPLLSSPSSSSLPSSSAPRPIRPFSPFLTSSVRPSPYLLSVIPPAILLRSMTPPDAKKIARWKRGRLVPLQPTLGSMLVCIAREYGLPSTLGISVYLSQPITNPFDKSEDARSGPQISSHTWSTLFSSYIHGSAPPSATSTPDQTPHKERGLSELILGHDREPLSPLALYPNRRRPSQPPSQLRRLRSSSTEPLKPEYSQSHSSHPSSSSTNAPQTPSTSFDSPLPIVGSIEFDIDLEEASWYEEWFARRTTRQSESGGIRELKLVDKVRHQEEVPRFFREQSLSVTEIPDLEPEISDAKVEADNGEEEDVDTGDPGLSPSRSSDYILRDNHGERRLSIRHIGTEQILVSASPSFGEFSRDSVSSAGDEDDVKTDELDPSPMARFPELREIDKRGSGVVMSEQLDDLERIMRSLSPREIRMTSPRLLTPRMAAKVANLTFPPPPRISSAGAKPPSSPLATGFVTTPDPNDPPTKLLPATPIVPPRAAWPAVPFVQLAQSPGSPSSITEFFPPSKSPISAETLKRMQSENAANNKSNGAWKPQRPIRPPSPQLAEVQYQNMSSDLAEIMNKSPEVKVKARSNSISLKGLRSQMSSKNLWQKKEKDAEAVGLFGAALDPAMVEQSSFAGIRGEALPIKSSTWVSEFGAALDNHRPNHGHSQSGSHSSRVSSNSFGRLFSFGSKRSSSFKQSQSQGHQKQTSVEISSPIMSNSPKSPTSPKNLRRKPVPNAANKSGEGDAEGEMEEDGS